MSGRDLLAVESVCGTGIGRGCLGRIVSLWVCFCL